MFYSDRISLNCPGQPWTCDPPAPVSWVAQMTGVPGCYLPTVIKHCVVSQNAIVWLLYSANPLPKVICWKFALQLMAPLGDGRNTRPQSWIEESRSLMLCLQTICFVHSRLLSLHSLAAMRQAAFLCRGLLLYCLALPRPKNSGSSKARLKPWAKINLFAF